MMKGNLAPAYGRVYSTEREAIKDWQDGKDFIFLNPSSTFNGRYCSIRDFGPDDSLQVKFGRGFLVKTMVVPDKLTKP